MRCGKKISMFIDITNSSTNTVNRLINLSSFIYTVENCSTLAEISRTVEENITPVVSRITVTMIGVDEILNRVHSIRIVLVVNIKYADRDAAKVNSNHMSILACLWTLNCSSMKKSMKYVSESTAQRFI